MNRLSWLILLLLLLKTASSFSQTVDINFNGFQFIDNREYKAFVPRSNTYFGTRVALDVGLNVDSINHFRIGVNGIHEFGARPFFLKINPIIYYNYINKSWLFNIGAFSRKGLLDNYPIALLNDTLNYYRPNIEGMLAKYSNNNFYENIWIDWVSRQTVTDRENFIFGASGKYAPGSRGSFYISNYFMMLHDAFASVKTSPYDHVRDNGGAQLRLGLDFSHRTILDSLTIEAGGMLSLERTRGIGGFKIPKGFVADLFMAYKRFGIHDSFYAGQGL